MDSLKTLTFYVATTSDSRSGFSVLQSACVGGDYETVRNIFLCSPSHLDTLIVINIAVENTSQHTRKTLEQITLPGFYHLKQCTEELHKGSCAGRQLTSPLIHVAARVGTVSHVRRLLAHGAQAVNDQYCGTTPLHLAAEHNTLDVVKYLVSRGAILSAKNDDGLTAGHVASLKGKTNTLLYLIGQNLKEPFSLQCFTNKDYEGYFNYLHLAILGRQKGTVAALIEKGYNVNYPCTGGLPRSVVRRYLYDIPYGKWFKGPDHWEENSPLMLSALVGSMDVFLLLVDNGANIFYRNLYGKSSLSCATEVGHSDIAKLLRSKAALQIPSWNKFENNELDAYRGN